MTDAVVVLHPSDAASLGINEGARLELQCCGETLVLPVRFSAQLPAGQIGLPLGLPGIPPYLSGATIDKLQEAAQ